MLVILLWKWLGVQHHGSGKRKPRLYQQANQHVDSFFVTNNVKTDMDDSPRGESLGVQAVWMKKLITNGVKPSTSSSSEAGTSSEVEPQQQIK